MSGDLKETYTWRPTVLRESTGAAISGVDWHAWDDDGDKLTLSGGNTTDANGQIDAQEFERRTIQITGTSTKTDVTETPHDVRYVKFGEVAKQLPFNAIASNPKATYFTDTQSNLTETNKSTVLGWTGIAWNHTLDEITLTSNWNMGQLYDRHQAEAEDNPVYDAAITGKLLELVNTIDNVNFLCYYDLVISGSSVHFTGQSKAIAFQNSTEMRMTGGGYASNLTVNEADTGSNGTTLTNLNVTGTLNFSVAGTYNLVGCSVNEVTNTSGGAVTIVASGGTNITTNTGPNITIQQNFTHTVTGLDSGSRVVWIRQSDGYELENQVESGGSASYIHPGGNVAVWVQILDLNKKNKWPAVTLGNADGTLPASQEDDRVYLNP